MTESKEPRDVLLTDSQLCKEVVSTLNRESVLAVHCLILDKGFICKLTLVLVGTYSGDVYLFDIQENMDLFTDGGLHSLLESDDILKVGFCFNIIIFHTVLLHYHWFYCSVLTIKLTDNVKLMHLSIHFIQLNLVQKNVFYFLKSSFLIQCHLYLQ